MIVDFDNLKIYLKEVEAITDVMHFTSKEGLFGGNTLSNNGNILYI